MPPEIQAEDPLVAGCHAFGHRMGINDNLGIALGHWLSAYYQSVADLPASRAAHAPDPGGGGNWPTSVHGCTPITAQIWLPNWFYARRFPVKPTGDRVFLACTIFTRYSGDTYSREPVLINRLLGDEGAKVATDLGLALRLACDLSAKSPPLLDQARLSQDGAKPDSGAAPRVGKSALWRTDAKARAGSGQLAQI